MRRYARTLAVILVLVTVAALTLALQSFSIGGFRRGEGSNNRLGLTLGLDLQGGSHLEYQAALKDPETEEPLSPTGSQMQALKRTIERRVNASGLGEPNIQILGDDRLLIQLPGVRDTARAKGLIGETARLEFKHRMMDVSRDIPGVSNEDILSVRTITVEQAPEGGASAPSPGSATSTATSTGETPEGQATSTAAGPGEGSQDGAGPPGLEIEFTEEAADAFAELVGRLGDSLGATPGADTIYPSYLMISVEGDDSPTLNIPHSRVFPQPYGQSIPLGGEPYIQRIPDTNRFTIDLSFALNDMEEVEKRFGEQAKLNVGELVGKLDEDVGLTGDDLARAYAGQHQRTGLPIVNIEFTSAGTRKFAEITAKIAGTPDLLAIVLDEEELIAPTVSKPITGGAAYIEGRDFTFDRVTDIALLLESGRLPIPIELIQERTVDAILGKDSLEKSVVAGIVGFALVLLFMVLYYRAAGVVAAAALMIYAMLVLSIFKMLPVTLTLSGVAAAILSIGMAVDANILIFERMKEELRAGRTLLSSINIGFNRAWPAIRDSNASTLITCGILFWFADTLDATLVKGFAITLAIGVAVSMFSAITVTRTFLRLMATTTLGKRLGLFVPSGGADLPQLQPTAEAV